MSYNEYAQKEHTSPYIFSLRHQNQIISYFGANHSCDPTNPQYALLEDAWTQFLEETGGKNCIVLVEGQLRNLYDSKTSQEAIRKAGGEGGYITFLAQQANIPVECPEPDSADTFQYLYQLFSQEIIAYAYFAQTTLSAIRCKKGSTHVSLDNYIEQCFTKVQKYFSLLLNIDTCKSIHKTLFNTPFNIEDEAFFYQITNPVADDSMINTVCREKSNMRNQHIVCTY